MPTIEANGQTLYYEMHGEGEPLLAVMGLAADTTAWTLQVPAFAARHRTVIFDNRDVGQSSMAEGPYEISDMARDALAVADALELESFHLLRRVHGRGHRPGGRTRGAGARADAHPGRDLAERRALGGQAE